MRILVAAAAALSLLALPAHAQMGGGRHRGEGTKAAEPKKPKIDEKAYKAAQERVPEPKEKYDPWGVARPTEPARKPK